MDAADALEDRADAAAEFMIMTVVKAFEIDLIQVNPGMQVFKNLRRAVAVGNEAGEKPRGLGLFEDGNRPLAGDERLVVGADQNLCALRNGVAHEKFGRGVERR